MNDQNFSLKGVIQKAKEYFKNWKDLSALIVVERLSTIISGLLIDVLMVFLGLIILIFLSFSLAFYLGEVTGSTALGFLLVSGTYLLLVIIIASLKAKIKDKLINLSIRKIFNNHNEADGN